jgi:serine/threonine-protein kinase RsbW
MPKLSFKTRKHVLPNGDETVVELLLSGFIDAANYMTFEKSLEEAFALGGRSLLIDFSRVNYINSTGISGLIRYCESCKGRGGILCLASVAKPVGLSMHLLGVTSLIPFTKDLIAGREHVADFHAGRTKVPADVAAEEAGSDDEKLTGLAKIVLRKTAEGAKKTGRILVISPSATRFTRVLRLRFANLNGEYHLMHDAKEALSRYEEIDPDIVVIDERCDPKGEFVSRVKVQKERSLTSIIKIYAKDAAVAGPVDFKIWENDYLVDPFEILELFTLTEAELRRVPRDRKVFSQQVHFEFRSSQENVEKAYKLSELVIRHSISEEEEITALYAAVKEGLDNAVVHGNLSAADKPVDVNFLVDQTKITVLIEDQGRGFDYEYYLSRLHRDDAFDEAKKRIVEENMRGGLGILLMSRCSDRIQYSGPGNVLRLEKNLR